MKVQVRKTKCCGVIRAACLEPDCYTDSEWLKDTRKHVQGGGTVELLECGSGWTFEKCACEKQKKAEKATTESLFGEQS